MPEGDSPRAGPSSESPTPGASHFFELAPEMAAIASARDRSWLRINPAFEDALGWKDQELQGQPILRLVHPDDHDELNRAIDAAAPGALGDPVNLHLLSADGAYAPTCWRLASSIPDSVFLFGCGAPDVERLALQAHVRYLGEELQHRVRNTLAVIRSIIRRSSESGRSRDYLASHIQGRIDAYTRAQPWLKFASGQGCDLDLASLIEDELLAQSEREGGRLRIKGPDLALKPKAAEALGLAIHELTMNAIKFGALGPGDGKVEIGWSVEGDRFVLGWTETGVRLDPAHTPEDGFGMETLLRSLPYELQGETAIEFRPTGLIFRMSAPLGTVSVS